MLNRSTTSSAAGLPRDVDGFSQTDNIQIADCAAKSGTVTIPAGQTSATVSVAVTGDRLAEPTEQFAVNLGAATNATMGDGQAIGTILDDEPRISINNVNKNEGNKNTTSFSFTVSLSAAYDQPVTVNYATANGTATGGTDYTAKSGAVTFAPGETIKTITVAIKGEKAEGTERDVLRRPVRPQQQRTDRRLARHRHDPQ